MGSTSYFPLMCIFADSYLVLNFENKMNIPFIQMVSVMRGYASRLKFCRIFIFRWGFWLGQMLWTLLLLQSNRTSAHKADIQLFSCSTDQCN